MTAALRLSLLANVALLTATAWLLWQSRPSGSAPPLAATQSAPMRRDTGRANAIAREDRPASATAQPTPATLAQLERAGISRSVLIDAIHEDFNRRSARRMVELQRRYAPKLVPDRELVEFARRDEAEWARELKASLGEDGFRAWDKEQTLRELNRARVPGDELPMSSDEAEQAYRLQKEFDDKSRELQAMLEDGAADRADVGALQAQAQQALDRGLERLLGKQRLDELRGNVDPRTDVYRKYGDLNPTPQQAQAVVQAEHAYQALQAAFAERGNQSPAGAASIAAELKAANDAREDQLRQIFGAEAYDQAKREGDPTYKTLRQYAGAWELKEPEVQSVYQTLHGFQEQAGRMRSAAELSQAAGQPVNWQQVNSAIEDARQQTAASLQNLIGPERVARLQQNGVFDLR